MNLSNPKKKTVCGLLLKANIKNKGFYALKYIKHLIDDFLSSFYKILKNTIGIRNLPKRI